MTLESLLQKHSSYHPAPQLELIKKAYAFAEAAHVNQVRGNNQPYSEHCLATAAILLDLKVDSYTLAAALLHDVLEHTDIKKEDLAKEFGPIVAELVDGVTDVKSLPTKTEGWGADHLDNLTKLLLATAKDVRVVLIRLAEKLHNLQTLEGLPEPQRTIVLKKARNIYGPLAERIGVHYLKRQFDDLTFKALDLESYQKIERYYWEKGLRKPELMQGLSQKIRNRLEENRLRPLAVFGRLKHNYSLYLKLQRYFQEGKAKDPWDVGAIPDTLAFTVLVGSVDECYTALALLCQAWLSDQSRYDDYIAHPKPNGYRAINVIVQIEPERKVEVQIKTPEMHEYNEFGPASHTYYKAEGDQKAAPVERIAWLKDLVKWKEEITEAAELEEALKVDVFGERIFVFTPKGDVVDLPEGATPVDFAYALHSGLGDSCEGAKINGRMASLDTRLKSRDQVEILTSKIPKKPNQDWLKFVTTTRAKAEIRQAWRRS